MYLAGLVSLGLREIAVITLVEGCVCCAYIGRLLPSEPRPYRLTGKHRHKHAQDGSPDTLPYPPSSNPDLPVRARQRDGESSAMGKAQGRKTDDGPSLGQGHHATLVNVSKCVSWPIDTGTQHEQRWSQASDRLCLCLRMGHLRQPRLGDTELETL